MSFPQRADMPTWECYELINARSVGRLCFLDGATPIAFPVSFKLHRTDAGTHIVIQTGAESLMAKYAEVKRRSRSTTSMSNPHRLERVARGEVRRSYRDRSSSCS
jgi:hypothetical protein